MPYIPQIKVGGMIYDVYDKRVDDLKIAVSGIDQMELIVQFDDTVTGENLITINQSIPAGTWNLHIDEITTDDTDAQRSFINFLHGSTTVYSNAFKRDEEINVSITFNTDVDTINFYASDSWLHGQDDTVTFKNVTITRVSPVTKEIEALRAEQNLNIDTSNNLFLPGDARDGGVLSNGYVDTSASTLFYTMYIPVSNVKKLYVYYGQELSTSTYCHAFYDASRSFVSTVSAAATGKYIVVNVPEGAVFARFTGIKAKIADYKIIPVYKDQAINSLESVNGLNLDTADAIDQLRQIDGNGALTLCHFTDIHGNEVNAQRVWDFVDAHPGIADDVICTGDVVNLKYSDGDYAFTTLPKAGKTLLTLGNHDQASGTGGNPYADRAQSMGDAYTRWFAPYASTNGITISSGKTYWYKDYATQKVRLIGLSPNLANVSSDEATAENTWLGEVLAGAKANDYAVVIAEHYPPANAVKVASSFTALNTSVPAGDYNTMMPVFQSTVQTFIDGGGQFMCYICGHTHCDFVAYNSDYPKQLFIVLTCDAIRYDSDQRRANGEKCQDAFNLVSFVPTENMVKVARIGAARDKYQRGRHAMSITVGDSPAVVYSD